MDWIYSLLFGTGVGHSILLVAVVIFSGILLGKITTATNKIECPTPVPKSKL